MAGVNFSKPDRRATLRMIGAAAVFGAATPALAASPKVRIRKLEQLPKPLPSPYNDTASPVAVDATVNRAFDLAERDGKRVIIDLGGNWCSWCRALSGVMALSEVKPFLDANFEIVHVGVSSQKGLTDKNIQVLKRFKINKIDGTPYLIVAEPDGSVLHHSSEVTDDKHETPQAMVDWLAQWAKRAPAASRKAAL